MAWRPTNYLLEGELDNTTPGKVTGWMRFAGMKNKVTFDLEGDFHRDIRGAKIHFIGDGREKDVEAASYMDGFAQHQTGKVGDITAGLPPQDYVNYPYIEWYGDDSGRVVIELEAGQIKVLGTLKPWIGTEPISREEQDLNMVASLGQIILDLNLKPGQELSDRKTEANTTKQARVKAPAMKFLTEEIRRQLPPLYGQDGKGGEAIVYAKFFTPDNSWTWYVTEFDPKEGVFFGLVDGLAKEMGYFTLAEIERATGPMGMHIERDIHWRPTRLRDIAPEMFLNEVSGGDQ